MTIDGNAVLRSIWGVLLVSWGAFMIYFIFERAHAFQLTSENSSSPPFLETIWIGLHGLYIIAGVLLLLKHWLTRATLITLLTSQFLICLALFLFYQMMGEPPKNWPEKLRMEEQQHRDGAKQMITFWFMLSLVLLLPSLKIYQQRSKPELPEKVDS